VSNLEVVLDADREARLEATAAVEKIVQRASRPALRIV
jgi:hypothetical protein